MVVIAAGVTAGSAPAPASTQQSVSLALRYACAFPSGSQPVSARVTASFPAAVAAGKPIKPAAAGITVTLPRAAIADLTRLNATTVGLTAALGTKLTDVAKSATAVWQDFRSPATAIGRSGPLTFTTSGVPPQLATGSPGEATVSAAGLSLVFTAASPAASSPGASSPPAPASVRASCVPRAGQDTILARVVVAGAAPAKASASSTSNPAKCLPFPTGITLNPYFPVPVPPPGAKKFPAVPQNGCAYVAGFTNAQKLHEAALVGPAFTDLEIGLSVYATNGDTYLQINSAGLPQYNGLPQFPPARATFLAFGFMPVSATLQLSEIGTLNAPFVTKAPGQFGCKGSQPCGVTTVSARMSLRLYDVDVNGVPLNVGSDCRTATPFNVVLQGISPQYSITTGGPLTGTVTIPPFAGCRDGTEDLDALFTAPVSGPGNDALITQGAPCTPDNGLGCPPAKPVPQH